MIRRLIGRQNQPGWPVARIRFARYLAGSLEGLFASLSAKWLRRSSPRSIRINHMNRGTTERCRYCDTISSYYGTGNVTWTVQGAILLLSCLRVYPNGAAVLAGGKLQSSNDFIRSWRYLPSNVELRSRKGSCKLKFFDFYGFSAPDATVCKRPAISVWLRH